MKMRDVKKQAERGRKLVAKNNYNLWSGELVQLHDIYTSSENGFYDAIVTAFLMGVSVGSRLEKSKRAKA